MSGLQTMLEGVLPTDIARLIRNYAVPTQFCHPFGKFMDCSFEDVAIHPNGQCYVTASRDGYVYCWSAETGAEEWSFRAHLWQVNQVMWLLDGTKMTLLTSGQDRTLKQWSLPPNQTCITNLALHTRQVRFWLSADNQFVFVMDQKETQNVQVFRYPVKNGILQLDTQPFTLYLPTVRIPRTYLEINNRLALSDYGLTQGFVIANPCSDNPTYDNKPLFIAPKLLETLLSRRTKIVLPFVYEITDTGFLLRWSLSNLAENPVKFSLPLQWRGANFFVWTVSPDHRIVVGVPCGGFHAHQILQHNLDVFHDTCSSSS